MIDDIDDLWAHYKATGDRALRDRLIVHYSPLLRRVARSVATSLPQHVDRADVASYGTFGLIDAIEKFDPQRGYRFETYAMSRIKGSIFDEFRSIDWVPRSVRTRTRGLAAARAKLAAELQRPPTDAELAAELDVTIDQLVAIRRSVARDVSALEEAAHQQSDTGEGMSLGDTIAAETEADLADGSRVEQLRCQLAKAIDVLGDQERTLVLLYYFENLTFGEISTVFGVTLSRVQQIHTKAVARLRGDLIAELPL